MNKKDLLQLEKLASLTPKEIENKQSALFSKLSDRASNNLKNTAEKRLKDAPKPVRDSLAKIDFSRIKLGGQDVKTALTKTMLGGRMSANKKKEAEAAIARVPDLGKLDDILQPELPVAVNPAFQPDLTKARMHRLSEITGLSAMKTDKALVRELNLGTITNDKLGEVVKERILTKKEAQDLGLAANLHAFFDSSFEMTEHAKKKLAVNSMKELAYMDKAGWKKLIKDSGAELPKDLKADDYAEILYKKAEKLFPAETLSHRISLLDTKNVSKSLDILKPLFEKNKQVFSHSPFEDLETDGLTAPEVKNAKARYDELNRLSNMHPGLKLGEIFNDGSLSAVDKGKKADERISLLDRFVKNNPDTNYLAISYTHDSKVAANLNFQGFSAEEKSMVLGTVKSYQRINSFTNDIEYTEAIMGAGYHSAFHITAVTLDNFIMTTKLDTAVATVLYENAHSSIIRTTGVMGSIMDIITGSFDWTAVGNTGPSIKDYLRKIPGYQDMFGELAFCDCEHCQSIYSPAAYFVDMMQFIEKYVINKHFTGTKASHVLNLKVRRPDLWTLPLTCENTNTLIPYADIINEIIETYIASKKGFAGDLADRSEVEEFVYKREIALEGPGSWKNKIHSFSQPFHLPLESVTTYLGHFEKSREDIAILLNRPPAEISKARLGLSEKEFQLITVPDETPAFIRRVFGITFTVISGKIAPFNARLLIKPMGVNRKELEHILQTRFVTNDGADNILIRGEKTSTDSIQNDIERVRNLTYSTLDRVHRFVRLWRRTSWSIKELDMVLTELESSGMATGIGADSVTAIGNLLRLQEMLEVSAAEICAIHGSIPAIILNDNEKSLLDKLFNHEDALAVEGAYPKNTTILIHPSLVVDNSTTPGEFSSSRLMTAFNRSDTEILILIQNLAGPLGITNIASATESERGFNLNLANLSLLYRHSIIAGILDLSVNELFQLLKLVPGVTNGFIENVNHIYETLNFHSWWKTTTFSLDELHYITKTGEVAGAGDFMSDAEIAAHVTEQAQSTDALIFAGTLFAYFDDITEQQSRSIIDANSSVIELAPDETNYRLTTSFDPSTPINVPADVTHPEPELREVLSRYHAGYLVPFFLTGQLGLSENSIGRIIDALGVDLNDTVFTLELQGVNTPPAALQSLAEKLLPLSILFRNKKFTGEVLTFITGNKDIFDIAGFDTITIGSVSKLNLLTRVITLTDDGQSNMDVVGEVLQSFNPGSGYQAGDQEKLSLVLNTEPALLSSIHPVTGTTPNAVIALERLRKFVSLCSYIGVGGDILPKIISGQYEDLNEATNSILAAFRSKYKSEEERKEKLENYQDKIRGRKRLSLTTYLIHSGFPQFESSNDLFHYFLIDTELEGCARTSRLVAATMTLQLYIHRILLNLEQDDKEPGTSGRVHVKADDIPGEEWVWRKNYRVWEANRKVFLYPENYIEPELRDDKSPLFDDLESELLQQEVNSDTVLEAYAKYMRGFDEVAHLKIAGSYHEYFKKDTIEETDVLHLFGVTADEPPVYYYRRVENLHSSERSSNRGVVWGPWRKISVQIPVRKVAPTVFNGRLHVFWVKITSLANTVFDNSRSIFTGYSHKFSIEFTTLKVDGTWTTPQKLNLKDSYPFTGNGVVADPLAEDAEKEELSTSIHNALRSMPFFDFSDVNSAIIKLKTPRYDTVPHYEPIDEYTLGGPMWEQVYPGVDGNRLILTGAGYQMRSAIDFYNLSVQEYGFPLSPGREYMTIVMDRPGKILARQGNTLYRASSPSVQLFDNYAYGSLRLNSRKTDQLLVRHWNQCTLDESFPSLSSSDIIAVLPAGSLVQLINGAFADAIIDVNGDLLLLLGTPLTGNGFQLTRMGTTLSETLTRTLFTSGVDTMLDIKTQKALKEAPSPVTISANRIENLVAKDKIDFNGAYGNYYREIFFHIPFLLANHLNSQGKYAEAQKWYHYIFNPTATEVIDFTDPALTAEDKKKLELDRNWQYLEFREIDVDKLRDQLNDSQAIEVYKKDPFNPHAIARLRMSAYQKSIVMKYIDNLLDWGDHLFSMDTMESINEATMLYVIAREILGDRPAEIGSCGEGNVNPKDYATISPLLDKGSEFLAELEHYTFKPQWAVAITANSFLMEPSVIAESTRKVKADYEYTRGVTYNAAAMTGMSMMTAGYVEELKKDHLPELTMAKVDDKVSGAFVKGTMNGFDWIKDSAFVNYKFLLPSFGISIIKHVSPVFCVPGNKELLDYYKRVDDRLFKIRNCMNIMGQRRQLSLFAPAIDPRLLVRARAAGLSLDDVLNSISGNLPPYRFSYILERARAFTSVVQSFGSSLLSALEKKSAEELTQLRITQQQNLLEMGSKSRQLEISSAAEGIKILHDKLESLRYQQGYYDQLISERINNWETLQSAGKHTASIIRGTEATIGFAAGMLSLIPQVGSPFAMKYGGVELGGSLGKIAFAMNSLANLGDNIAGSSGLEAGFERRKQGWEHQKKLIDYEIKQTEKNLIATEIRRDILIESEKIHNKNIEHNNEVMEFYGDKFSNLGLYTWLSSTMQRLFREAYNNALAVARLAEQAYRFERDDNTVFIDGNYFESPRAGLLAGERLLMSLQNMDRRHLETNYRKFEIDQPFSLTQINPSALLNLKQTGTCDFSIPEIYFDLFYPGQYRRKIKSVRITIPSVTGPYTNVSATLSLTGSQVRMESRLGGTELKDVPRSRTTTIATSTAQNDAGVFQINFRDDRYMPFEGAGAVNSDWKLSLPKNFRQFDYRTINDIIIHVSYTAEYDELFRDKVEEQNDEIEGTLLNYLKNNSLSRTFSLRQEFSNDFYRLTEQAVGQPVAIKVQNKHFPLFLNGSNLKVTRARLILSTPKDQTAAGVDIVINGVSQTGFTKDPSLGELFTKDLGDLFNSGIIKDHTIAVSSGGDLAPAAPAAGPASAVDVEKLEDIILLIEYRIG